MSERGGSVPEPHPGENPLTSTAPEASTPRVASPGSLVTSDQAEIPEMSQKPEQKVPLPLLGDPTTQVADLEHRAGTDVSEPNLVNNGSAVEAYHAIHPGMSVGAVVAPIPPQEASHSRIEPLESKIDMNSNPSVQVGSSQAVPQPVHGVTTATLEPFKVATAPVAVISEPTAAVPDSGKVVSPTAASRGLVHQQSQPQQVMDSVGTVHDVTPGTIAPSAVTHTATVPAAIPTTAGGHDESVMFGELSLNDVQRAQSLPGNAYVDPSPRNQSAMPVQRANPVSIANAPCLGGMVLATRRSSKDGDPVVTSVAATTSNTASPSKVVVVADSSNVAASSTIATHSASITQSSNSNCVTSSSGATSDRNPLPATVISNSVLRMNDPHNVQLPIQTESVFHAGPMANVNTTEGMVHGSLTHARMSSTQSTSSTVNGTAPVPTVNIPAPNATTTVTSDPAPSTAANPIGSTGEGGPKSDIAALLQTAQLGVSGRSSTSHVSHAQSNSTSLASAGPRSSIASVARLTPQDLFGGPRTPEPDSYLFSLPATLFAQGLVDSLEGIAVRILSYLTIKELLRLRRISSRFRDLISMTFERLRVVNLDQFWSKLGLRHNAAVLRLASSFKSCTSLSLGYCNQVKEPFLMELLDAIFPTPERRLELRHLRLYYCFLLTDSTIHTLCKRFPRLRVLDIGSCRLLTDRSVTALASLPELNYLNISSTGVSGPAFFQALTKDPGTSAAAAASAAYNRFSAALQLAARRLDSKGSLDFEASDVLGSEVGGGAVLFRTASGVSSSIDSSMTPAASSGPTVPGVAGQAMSVSRSHFTNGQPPRGHVHSQSVDQRAFRALTGGSHGPQVQVSPQSVASESTAALHAGDRSLTGLVVTDEEEPEPQVDSGTTAATMGKAITPKIIEEVKRDRPMNAVETRPGEGSPTLMTVTAAAVEPVDAPPEPSIAETSQTERTSQLKIQHESSMNVREPGQSIQLAQLGSMLTSESSPRAVACASPGHTSVPESRFGVSMVASNAMGPTGGDSPQSTLAEYPVTWPIQCSFPAIVAIELRECQPASARTADFDMIRQRHPKLKLHVSQFWYNHVNNSLNAAIQSAAQAVAALNPCISPSARSGESMFSPGSRERRPSEGLEQIAENIAEDGENEDGIPTNQNDATTRTPNKIENPAAAAAAATAASAHAAAVHAAFAALAVVTPPLAFCMPLMCTRTSSLSAFGGNNPIALPTALAGAQSSSTLIAGSKLPPPLAVNQSPSLSNPASTQLTGSGSSEMDVQRGMLGVQPSSEPNPSVILAGKPPVIAPPVSAPVRAQSNVGVAATATSPTVRNRALVRTDSRSKPTAQDSHDSQSQVPGDTPSLPATENGYTATTSTLSPTRSPVAPDATSPAKTQVSTVSRLESVAESNAVTSSTQSRVSTHSQHEANQSEVSFVAESQVDESSTLSKDLASNAAWECGDSSQSEVHGSPSRR